MAVDINLIAGLSGTNISPNNKMVDNNDPRLTLVTEEKDGLMSKEDKAEFEARVALLPSASEKLALNGTTGTPSDLNKYVTDEDGRLVTGTTTTIHIDGNRTDSYTETGTADAPFKTIAAAMLYWTTPGTPAYQKAIAVDLSPGTYDTTGGVYNFPSYPLHVEGDGANLTGAATYTISAGYAGYHINVEGNIIWDTGVSTYHAFVYGGTIEGNITARSGVILHLEGVEIIGNITCQSGGTIYLGVGTTYTGAKVDPTNHIYSVAVAPEAGYAINKAVVINEDGVIATSDTTAEEISYLQGLRANAQNQLDRKAELVSTTWVAQKHSVKTLGSFTVSQIETIADVSGSLGGLYFQIAGPALSSTLIDYSSAGEDLVDVWFNVDSGSSAPTGTGAARQVEVNISANDDATAVATAIVASISSDVCFTAGRDGTIVRIATTTIGQFSAISAGTSGMTVSTVASGDSFLSATAAKYFGGVFARNGKIYCVPRNATTVLVIDPEAGSTYEPITGLAGDNKWGGGCLAKNGKIYCAPRDATSVLVIDPATDTAYQIELGMAGSNKYLGIASGLNGKLYFAPNGATAILVVDPTDDSFYTIADGLSSAINKWAGIVSAKNGKLYGIPSAALEVFILDPITETVSFITATTDVTTNKWYGGAEADNACIYCCPTSASTLLVIDTTNDTTSELSLASTAGNKWVGIQLAPDGLLYCPPNTAGSILVINPTTNTTSEIPVHAAGSFLWYGINLAPNGNLYCVAAAATSILVIGGGGWDVPRYLLSPQANGF